MKGAIEYLRAVRDICSVNNCDECPIIGICPWMGEYPRRWTDGYILRMLAEAEQEKRRAET